MNAWTQQLEERLLKQLGKSKGLALSKKYVQKFPAGYRDDFDAIRAEADIAKLETLSENHTLAISLYFKAGEEGDLHLRLYQWRKPVPLSDVLPMLENFNLRTLAEHPYKIQLEKNKMVWIKDFHLEYKEGKLELEKVKVLFEDAFAKVYFNLAENDGFNKLILGASLSWQEVIILRAYAKYLHQIRFQYSQAYIEKALINNASLMKDLVEYFKLLHDPGRFKKNQSAALEVEILQKLESIPALDEDTIIRRILSLIKATLRTNYFQRTHNNEIKHYLALKLNSRTIPEMPLPAPLFETFVYSSRFEGIHLRNAKIARGGLRWSDRREDYRTEILGLMKAQVVKNSVIVPSGAKGGFVLKAVPPGAGRDFMVKEVTYCYTGFVSGLLDLADNIKDGAFVPPKDVVCHDSPDPYLVVAADKGTATFSDLANSISKAYDFWLGDAFASGGSAGYDHKKMGITARGAWESAKRHFRELDINIAEQPITVVGIGDMSGDVFGNGLLYSKNLKLVGAFDHRHIFIDPNPDAELSFAERQRLFTLPVSSWEDYNPSLISAGGGVFKRTLKSIPVTAEMKQRFYIEEDTLTPDELIRALLKSPVDLLFNGGIGTYVKSSQESQAEVGDRSNERCRINGKDLRCRVVCEGGNLGFTQRGRVEFALHGGLINTDFIDNSAGVDCSDHEVNLKILLDHEVQQGNLSRTARNNLLMSLTSEIAQLVLKDNYHQALALSFSRFSAAKDIVQHTDYIKHLEAQGILDRQVEFLPDDKELIERKVEAIGLTRPELAVLLAYTKINLKAEILKSDLPEDAYLKEIIQTAFPAKIGKKYKKSMQQHQLHRDIIATQLANEVVNNIGMTFIYQTQKETGTPVDKIIRAYTAASAIFETNELQRMVESLDFKISLAEQFDIITNIRHLLILSTRWFLQGRRLSLDLQELIGKYYKSVKRLEKIIPELMGGFTKQYLASMTMKFQKSGLSQAIAERIATYRAIYTALNIIEVAHINGFDLIKAAKVYFASGERMNLLWFRDQIASESREGHWNTLARFALRDELDNAQQAMTVAIMQSTPDKWDVNRRIDRWVSDNQTIILRWEQLLSMLHSSQAIEYSMFFIVIREFIRLIQAACIK
ncbi:MULTISPECIES: NAD-glutamate dehydrogenase [Legionella]|uniref:NAD-glutamate dehydrogenase n=1 Tax=Legionella septentrionalis TaxID=2498109 RepID=A0A3S0VAJ9_9GAMM|nr:MULTISPECIES: NAD-glutamate dehydrogenase domain-containing protein [Legionella]MCP0913715.1 NAD-glutamate dehydrogenase [Legionella sp. 27cVA30]RUQ85420.1 NAD-glutamate dehydrogenase [Legionella septentrionalis]RUR09613.1 NAD-glutamate dehydrogenase [Legionella septentrionalis]RUR14811.1 NAD-glutamate dehydrogenase [Legionella septentrionalis]